MILDFTYVHTVTVETLQGTKAGKPAYADPVSRACWIDDSTKMVRDSNGREVVSTGTVFASLDPADASLDFGTGQFGGGDFGDPQSRVPAAGAFAPGSRVTLATRTAYVLSCNVFDSSSLALGLDHIEVHLT